jgi:hypothetical protein
MIFVASKYTYQVKKDKMNNELILALLEEIAALKVEVSRLSGKTNHFEEATGIHFNRKEEINKELQLLKLKLKLE